MSNLDGHRFYQRDIDCHIFRFNVEGLDSHGFFIKNIDRRVHFNGKLRLP